MPLIPFKKTVNAKLPTQGTPVSPSKPSLVPKPKKALHASHNEPDGHFVQILGKPIAAKLATAGMQIAWGGRVYVISTVSKPAQVTNARGKAARAPSILVIRMKDGPTITAKPDDTLYREIVSEEKAP